MEYKEVDNPGKYVFMTDIQGINDLMSARNVLDDITAFYPKAGKMYNGNPANESMIEAWAKAIANTNSPYIAISITGNIIFAYKLFYDVKFISLSELNNKAETIRKNNKNNKEMSLSRPGEELSLSRPVINVYTTELDNEDTLDNVSLAEAIMKTNDESKMESYIRRHRKEGLETVKEVLRSWKFLTRNAKGTIFVKDDLEEDTTIIGPKEFIEIVFKKDYSTQNSVTMSSKKLPTYGKITVPPSKKERYADMLITLDRKCASFRADETHIIFNSTSFCTTEDGENYDLVDAKVVKNLYIQKLPVSIKGKRFFIRVDPKNSMEDIFTFMEGEGYKNDTGYEKHEVHSETSREYIYFDPDYPKYKTFARNGAEKGHPIFSAKLFRKLYMKHIVSEETTSGPRLISMNELKAMKARITRKVDSIV